MYRLKEKLDVQIIAYCIMNNHAHILIKTNNIHELGKYMQCLNTKYGKYYNKKYNRIGYVFRDRYKSEGIYTGIIQVYKAFHWITIKQMESEDLEYLHLCLDELLELLERDI